MKLCNMKNFGFAPLVQYCRHLTILYARNSSPKLKKDITDSGQIQCKSFQAALTPHRKSCLCAALSDSIIHRQRMFSTHCAKFAVHHDTFDGQPQSWLFVSNAVAGAYGAQVNVDLDLDQRLAPDSLVALQENVRARGIDFDVMKLESIFKQLKSLKMARQSLDERRYEVLRLLKEVEDKNARDSLAAELRRNKKEMKKLMTSLWNFEEQVMTAALQLPNDLHSNTSLAQAEVKRETNTEKGKAVQQLTHVEIAKKFDLIKFSNVGPKAYYLKRKLAAAETLLTDVADDFFHCHGYRLMFGPEFFKTPVMEGCGLDVYDTGKVLTMQHTSRDIEPMLHLAGISPMTFAAYLARLNIGNASLPLRMFSMGRTYQRRTLPGLFGATQSTQVGLFSCVGEDQVEAEFDYMTQMVWDFVQSFGFHIRLCHVGAKGLQREEKRRTEIQVFAPSLNAFVPIARISDLADFVSRRLMTFHSENHGDIRSGKFVHMISGVALNVTSFLAVWMESSYNGTSDEFVLRELPPLRTCKKTT